MKAELLHRAYAATRNARPKPEHLPLPGDVVAVSEIAAKLGQPEGGEPPGPSDTELLEQALRVAVSYHADGLIRLAEADGNAVLLDREGLIATGMARAKDEARVLLAAKGGEQ